MPMDVDSKEINTLHYCHLFISYLTLLSFIYFLSFCEMPLNKMSATKVCLTFDHDELDHTICTVLLKQFS